MIPVLLQASVEVLQASMEVVQASGSLYNTSKCAHTASICLGKESTSSLLLKIKVEVICGVGLV